MTHLSPETSLYVVCCGNPSNELGLGWLRGPPEMQIIPASRLSRGNSPDLLIIASYRQ